MCVLQTLCNVPLCSVFTNFPFDGVFGLNRRSVPSGGVDFNVMIQAKVWFALPLLPAWRIYHCGKLHEPSTRADYWGCGQEHRGLLAGRASWGPGTPLLSTPSHRPRRIL